MVGGEKQVPGGRIQESGVRMKSICFPLSAFCRLPAAFEGGGMERVLRRHASPGQDVTSDSERKNK